VLRDQFGGARLVRRVQLAEDAGHGDLADARRARLLDSGEDGGFIQRGDFAPVKFEAAAHHRRSAAHHRLEIVGPGGERRNAAPGGKPMRMANTGTSSRRWMKALVKWVVPIMTASIASGVIAHSEISAVIASAMPELTSLLVGRFTAPSTFLPDRRTASVFVPPTSTPIRIEALRWWRTAFLRRGRCATRPAGREGSTW
jgi:hypothetical protein